MKPAKPKHVSLSRGRRPVRDAAADAVDAFRSFAPSQVRARMRTPPNDIGELTTTMLPMLGGDDELRSFSGESRMRHGHDLYASPHLDGRPFIMTKGWQWVLALGVLPRELMRSKRPMRRWQRRLRDAMSVAGDALAYGQRGQALSVLSEVMPLACAFDLLEGYAPWTHAYGGAPWPISLESYIASMFTAGMETMSGEGLDRFAWDRYGLRRHETPTLEPDEDFRSRCCSMGPGYGAVGSTISEETAARVAEVIGRRLSPLLPSDTRVDDVQLDPDGTLRVRASVQMPSVIEQTFTISGVVGTGIEGDAE